MSPKKVHNVSNLKGSKNRSKSSLIFGSPGRQKPKKDDLSPSMHSSWAPCDSQSFKMQSSQPITIPAHRRSKSSLEYRASPSSTSTTYSTPDMVPDIVDQPPGNVVRVLFTVY